MQIRKSKGLLVLRQLKLQGIKLYRLNDSPQRIALGFGIGVFFGVLPGLGVVTAVLLAALLKINRVSAFLGSFATNSWISFLTFIVAVKTGAWIAGMRWKELAAQCAAPFHNFHVKDLLHHEFWHTILSTSFLKIILPLIIGYLLVSLTLGFISYITALVIIKKFRAYREKKKAAKARNSS